MGFLGSLFSSGGGGGAAPASDASELEGASLGSANITPYQSGEQSTVGTGLGYLSNVYNQAETASQNATNPAFNPAIPLFNQATMQNVQSTSAEMASQRGAGQNPGLIAYQAGQQGANTQQQAVNQLGALTDEYAIGEEQLAEQAAGAYTQGALTDQGQILSAIAAQNSANVAMQSNINDASVAMASNINNNLTSMQENVNSVNASLSEANMEEQGSMFGGLLGGLGLGLMLLHKGGEVPGYASGGDVDAPDVDEPDTDASTSVNPAAAMSAYSNPTSSVYKAPGGSGNPLSQVGQILQASSQTTNSANGLNKGASQFSSDLIQKLFGGQPDTGSLQSLIQNSPQLQAPTIGSQVAGGQTPQLLQQSLIAGLARGGKVRNLKTGGGVPGKAKVHGDSLKNDTVPAKLSPGEIVIPRSISKGPNAPARSAQFVAACLARSGSGLRAGR